ncbi:hypothetical protein IAR55_002768 [Kwoniella newhampshirensis]|uniref:BHLH domain-containing protein n=1 Tax=Kwoniella newhampshirensis TaxID=1651941 RepID=A0AAW0YSN3_9TREE
MNNTSRPRPYAPDLRKSDSSTAGLSDDLSNSSLSFVTDPAIMDNYLMSQATQCRDAEPSAYHTAGQGKYGNDQGMYHGLYPPWQFPMSPFHQSVSSRLTDQPYPAMTLNYGGMNSAPSATQEPVRHSGLCGFQVGNIASSGSTSIGSSPDESSGIDQLSSSAASTVSPALLSPQSTIVAQMSSTSPTDYRYQGISYTGTPHDNITALGDFCRFGGAMGLAAELSYHTQPVGQQQQDEEEGSGWGKVATRRVAKLNENQVTSSPDDLQSSSTNASGPISQEGHKKRRTVTTVLDPVKAQQIRHNRVVSEQQRRNALRDAFNRLADALPHTNDRRCKMNILAQSLEHVQRMGEANRSLTQRVEELQRRCDSFEAHECGEVKSSKAIKGPGHRVRQ